MVILVKTLLALLCSCFKLFSCICSLDSINNFFNSLSLTIVHACVAFNYSATSRYLFLITYLLLGVSPRFKFCVFVYSLFFRIFYNIVNKLLISRQRFLSLSFVISYYEKDFNLFIAF
jgi:hypothetical protein